MKIDQRRVCSILIKIAAIVAFAAAFSAKGYAEEALVLTEPLAPVHFEEAGEIKGIATEIVQAIFKEAGIEPRFEIYPWKRAYQKALLEKDSFIFTLNRTENREQLFKWIGPILTKDVYLYRLKSREDLIVNSLEDVKNYTTTVILGHSLTTMLRNQGFREGEELITTPSKEVQIKVFLKGRCDFITGNQYTIYESLRTEGFSLSHVVPALFIVSDGYYIGAGLDVSDALVEKLQAANDKVRKSGIVEEIIDKYIR